AARAASFASAPICGRVKPICIGIDILHRGSSSTGVLIISVGDADSKIKWFSGGGLKPLGGRAVRSRLPTGSSTAPARSGGHRERVDPVDRSVVLERDGLQIRGQPRDGDAAVEGAVDDLQLHPGRRVPQAVVHAGAEYRVV